MWAHARFDLGLSPEDFWELTLAELRALTDRWRDAERRQDRRAALLACMIAEPNRDRAKRPEPFQVDDFMPKEQVEEPEAIDPKFGVPKRWIASLQAFAGKR